MLLTSRVEKRFAGRAEPDQESTTNQRAEIIAAIEALRRVNRPCDVTVFSDSQYLVNTMMRGWRRRKNVDLWTLLDMEVRKHESVTFRWVRGHNGNALNEVAHALAEAAL